MAALTSLLSALVISAVQRAYTNASLVSKATGDDILEQDVLPEWIEQAREEIDRRSGMSFIPQEKIDLIDGNGLEMIFTSAYPILQVLKIFVDGSELPASEFVVNRKTGSIRLRERLWGLGLQNIEVRYIVGFNVVPPLVQKIATLLAAKSGLSAKYGPLVDNESIGDFTQTRTFKKLNDELDRSWEALGRTFPIDFI